MSAILVLSNTLSKPAFHLGWQPAGVLFDVRSINLDNRADLPLRFQTRMLCEDLLRHYTLLTPTVFLLADA